MTHDPRQLLPALYIFFQFACAATAPPFLTLENYKAKSGSGFVYNG